MSKNSRSDRSNAGMLVAIVISIVATVSFSGCKNFIFRPQSPDHLVGQLQSEAEDVKYIGDICRFWGLNYAKVETVGLVRNLKGTGSDPDNNNQRKFLIGEMKAHRVDNPDEVLASKNTSMVLLKGFIPPGCRKGEKFDILVGTMPRSKTTSLANGYCLQTHLRPVTQLGSRTRMGHNVGKSGGYILTNQHFDDANTHRAKVQGMILGGGVATTDRPIGLAIQSEESSVRLSTRIANAINARFSVYNEGAKVGVATAKSDRNVELMVPEEYKHNLGRFVRIVLSIAYQYPKTSKAERVEKLEQQLNQPAFARQAAMRLEAIGEDATGALRRGLNHGDAEVRFFSAESLAYLGKAVGAKQLAEAARVSPTFRWHALTALASLDDTQASIHLANLLHAKTPELRYGAFRAMRSRAPNDPTVGGKMIRNDFYLHVIPSSADPMLHVSRRKRREIVVFNDNQTFGNRFMFIKPGITARSVAGNKMEIKVYRPEEGDQIVKCSRRVSEVIENLGKFGCDYGCIIDMLRDAKKNGEIKTNVVIDAIPKIGGRTNSPSNNSGTNGEARLPNPGEAPLAGPMPELFRTGSDDDYSDYDESGSIELEQSDPVKPEEPPRKTGFFDKIKERFKR